MQHVRIVLIVLANVVLHMKGLNAETNQSDDSDWLTDIISNDARASSQQLIICNGSLVLNEALWVSRATLGTGARVRQQKKCIANIGESKLKKLCYLHLRILNLDMTSTNGNCNAEFLIIENEKHQILAKICGEHQRKDVFVEARKSSRITLTLQTMRKKSKKWRIQIRIIKCTKKDENAAQKNKTTKVSLSVKKKKNLCSLQLENCGLNTENNQRINGKLCPDDCRLECVDNATEICRLSCRLSCRQDCQFTNNLTNPFSLPNCCRCICKGTSDTLIENPNWKQNLGRDWSLESSCRCVCNTKASNVRKKSCKTCVCPLGKTIDESEYSGDCRQGCVKVSKSLCEPLKNVEIGCHGNCRLRCNRGRSPGCDYGCELFCWKNCPFKGRGSEWKDYERCCKCLCYKNGNGPWIKTVNHSAVALARDSEFGENCGCECDLNLFNDECIKEPWCYKCNCPFGVVAVSEPNKACRKCPKGCLLVKKNECSVKDDRGAFCDRGCRLSCAVDISPGCNVGCKLVCLPGCLFTKFNVEKRGRPKCCSCICKASNGNRWLEQVNWDSLVRYDDKHFIEHCACNCGHEKCQSSRSNTTCTKCTCPLNENLESKGACKLTNCQNKVANCPSHCQLKCTPDGLTLDGNVTAAAVVSRCRCECSPSSLICDQAMPQCYSCDCPVRVTGASSRIFVRNYRRSFPTNHMYCVKCRPFCRLKYDKKCSMTKISVKRKHVCNAKCTFRCDSGTSSGCPANCELNCDRGFSPFVDFKNDFKSQSKCRCICYNTSELSFQVLAVDWTKHSANYDKCTCSCSPNKKCHSNADKCNHCVCKVNNENVKDDKQTGQCQVCNNGCKLLEDKSCPGDKIKSNTYGSCGRTCALTCNDDPSFGCSKQCHLVCGHGCAFKGNTSKVDEVKKCCTCSCNKHGHAWTQSPNFDILLKASQLTIAEKCRCNCLLDSDLCKGALQSNSSYECNCQLKASKGKLRRKSEKCRLVLKNGEERNLGYLACAQDCRLKCESGENLGCKPGCGLVCLPNCPILGPSPRQNAKACCKCKCKDDKMALDRVDWKKFTKVSYDMLKESCTCICRPKTENLAKYWPFGDCVKCICPLKDEERQTSIPRIYEKLEFVSFTPNKSPICTNNCKTVVTKSCSYKTNIESKCPKRCSFVCKSAGVQVGCPTSCSFVCKTGCPFTGSLLNITKVSSCCGCECPAFGGQGMVSLTADWNVVANVHGPLWDIMCECNCPPITDTCSDRSLALECYQCTCPTLTEQPRERAILSSTCPTCIPSHKCKAHITSGCEGAIERKYVNICPRECSFECDVGQTSACPIECFLQCNNEAKQTCRCICNRQADRPVSWLQVLTEPDLAESCGCKCPVMADDCPPYGVQPDCYYCKCPTQDGVTDKLAASITKQTECLSCRGQGCVLRRNDSCKNAIETPPHKPLCNDKCGFRCQRGRSPGCGLNCRLECVANCPFKGNGATEEEVRQCCRCICNDHNSSITMYEPVNYAAIISTKSFHSYCRCLCQINSWECSSNNFNDACYQCECPIDTTYSRASSKTFRTRDDNHSCIKCPHDNCIVKSDLTCSNQLQPVNFCGKTCRLKCLKGQSPGCSLHCGLTCDENCPFYGWQSREEHADKCCKCKCDNGVTSWYTPVNWAAVFSTKTFGDYCFCDCSPQIGNCNSASVDSDCFKCLCPLYSTKQSNRLDYYTKKCISCPDDGCKVLTHKECGNVQQTAYEHRLRRTDDDSWLEIEVGTLLDSGESICKKNCGTRCGANYSFPICNENCNLTCLPGCPFNGKHTNWDLARRCCSCKCLGHETDLKIEEVSNISGDLWSKHCDCLCPPLYADCTAKNVRLNCHDCVCPGANSTRNVTGNLNDTNSCLKCDENCYLETKTECEVYRRQGTADDGKKGRRSGDEFSSENIFFYTFHLKKFEQAVKETSKVIKNAYNIDVKQLTNTPQRIENLALTADKRNVKVHLNRSNEDQNICVMIKQIRCGP